LPKDLQGKQIVSRLAELDIDLKFGLWKDYSEWVDLAQHPDCWYSLEMLKKTKVNLEVCIGNEPVYVQTVDTFGNIKIHVAFNDAVPDHSDLRIKISRMDQLPVRNNHESFVCGMFQIESVKIQGIEIIHLLSDTMFGKDTEICVPMTKPIYSWMVKNHSRILPGVFDLPTWTTVWQR
jgi:hypothetical protein